LTASGGGTLLGGSYQKGIWDSAIDPNLAVRIMKRAVQLCPSLTGGKGIEHLSIIRHGVGLRPVRNGGTRIEKERVNGVWVVHNYGHGGYGYQVRIPEIQIWVLQVYCSRTVLAEFMRRGSVHLRYSYAKFCVNSSHRTGALRRQSGS